MVERAAGARLYDDKGRSYLDFYNNVHQVARGRGEKVGRGEKRKKGYVQVALREKREDGEKRRGRRNVYRLVELGDEVVERKRERIEKKRTPQIEQMELGEDRKGGEHTSWRERHMPVCAKEALVYECSSRPTTLQGAAVMCVLGRRRPDNGKIEREGEDCRREREEG